MGYTTDFYGKFKLDAKLTPRLKKEILEFSETRHDEPGYPGIWCNWAPSSCGEYIEWNEAEKFYDYIEWLEYIINKFLKPNNYILNGTVEWKGEDDDDIGKIIVKDNQVSHRLATITYEDVDALLAENRKLKEELAEYILLAKTVSNT